MTRSVPEWIGKTDDAMPPAKVRQRILERENHTCHICGGEITKPGWHADHVPPLKDGGTNRESKIKPAHAKCHVLLTATQAKERAHVERMKMKASGAIRPKQSINSRGFPKSPKPERDQKRRLGPKMLYAERVE